MPRARHDLTRQTFYFSHPGIQLLSDLWLIQCWGGMGWATVRGSRKLGRSPSDCSLSLVRVGSVAVSSSGLVAALSLGDLFLFPFILLLVALQLLVS